MRVILVLFAVTAITTLPSRAQAAPIYRYCAAYGDRGDVTCAYDTLQQCLDTARGPAGGSCGENPAWHPPVRRKAKRHYD